MKNLFLVFLILTLAIGCAGNKEMVQQEPVGDFEVFFEPALIDSAGANTGLPGESLGSMNTTGVNLVFIAPDKSIKSVDCDSFSVIKLGDNKFETYLIYRNGKIAEMQEMKSGYRVFVNNKDSILLDRPELLKKSEIK